MSIRIVDVEDEPTFGLIPPCADPSFDHRSCDYWEDADRGSKKARAAGPSQRDTTLTRPRNPFGDDDEPGFNPFAPGRDPAAFNPFAPSDDPLAGNPFAPARKSRPTVAADAPRKLGLLGRGLGVFGSYAKVLLVDDRPTAYAQFGPLSAYPRAARVRELYPQLPESPLPAVITCIASTAEGRGQGHARTLVEAVCDDLAGRGFAAIEVYPEPHRDPNSTSAATPEFWLAAGFALAVIDDRYPVLRREL